MLEVVITDPQVNPESRTRRAFSYGPAGEYLFFGSQRWFYTQLVILKLLLNLLEEDW
ncbi:hypothetical protein HYS91_03700 [Candidatus Daviesbacteria bacterium]|nr:hypothetical protein [Candidatus Daviesbacteria bacterium]